MRLRSPRELAFRLQQRALQFSDYLLTAPDFRGSLSALPLPAPSVVRDALAGSAFAAEIVSLAERILAHDFPLLGSEISTGLEIDWRRDYIAGISSPAVWWRKIPFLDAHAVGDHKVVWELNRHQHLVVLAQAWVLSRDDRYLREIERQFASWVEQNPFVRSINWASSLEIAFRALSWLWVVHLAGEQLSSDTIVAMKVQLYRHGVAIRHNLSTYFAPNTHILGEGLVLEALGIALSLPAWRGQGARIVDTQFEAQVQADGFHFEQSTYYHLYALDMFLFHYVIGGRPAKHERVIGRMAACMAALVDGDLEFPSIGDDDGGRFFHPYGDRATFARGTLATCSALFPALDLPCRAGDLETQAVWWLGPSAVADRERESRSDHLTSSGLTAISNRRAFLTFDCGSFGRGSAGHSHADSLSLTLTLDGEEVLIDPGTFTYTGDPEARNWFRGTYAHSTVRLGGRDQADPAHAFRWDNVPVVRRVGEMAGECVSRGQTHRREIELSEGELVVVDVFEGLPQGCLVEQNWHFAMAPVRLSDRMFRAGCMVLIVDAKLSPEIVPAFRSRTYGQREPSFILSCKANAPIDSKVTTRIVFG